MARPRIAISVPARVVAGTLLEVGIDVSMDEAQSISYVEATIHVEHGHVNFAGSVQGAGAHFREVRLVDRVAGITRLEPGTRRFVARFRLPSTLPPCHGLAPGYARARIEVHIGHEWKSATRASLPLAVSVEPPSEVVRTPVVASSTAKRRGPRIEIALASSRLLANEAMIGTCAVFHLDDRKDREVELAVLPELTIREWRQKVVRGRATRVSLTIPAGGAGKVIPFRIAEPGTSVPAFTCDTHAVHWVLVARVGSLFRGRAQLTVPLDIVDATAKAPPLAAVPLLGEVRVASQFEQLARKRGWRTGAMSISTTIDASELRVDYEVRAEVGEAMIGTIEYPSLGLGLDVTASRKRHHSFFPDAVGAVAYWGSHHDIAVRSIEQATPFLAALAPQLAVLSDAGTLLRWTDRELVYARPASSIDETGLEDLASDLEGLAARISEARAQIAPPPDVTVDVAAWQELARTLEGTLVLGDLGIVGRYGGSPVEVGLRWDSEGRVTSVGVSIGDPESAPVELRALALALPLPADASGVAAAEPIAELVSSWPPSFAELHVLDGTARAVWRLPAGDLPVTDVAQIRALIAALHTVLTTLAQSNGPYR